MTPCESIRLQVRVLSPTLNMKKKSKAPIVLKYYPNAKPIKKGNHVEIWSDDQYLGQGKSNKQAWSAAYNNRIND